MGRPRSMDSLSAPLTPCSLETIPEPVELADGSSVWPLMLSCYELQDNGSRRGHMSLFSVPVPDIAGSNLSSMPLQFGEPYTVLDAQTSSGILDGKWFPMETTSDADSDGKQKAWSFATAHSTGEIRIHALQVPQKTDDLPRLESDSLYSVKFLGESVRPAWDNDPSPPLCLSLSWDTTAATTTVDKSSDLSIMVSTYSNGKVAIHDVAFDSDGQAVQIMERDSWQAHNIFTSPAEVWSATFAHDGDRNMVLSCGDEGAVKIWDIRATR